jgi:hypothetical protein
MKCKQLTSILFLAVFICLAASAVLADIKVKQKMTMSGQSFESTTLIKGARQRTEQNMGVTMITLTECDLKQMVMINDAARKYMITSLDPNNSTDDASRTPPTAAAQPATPTRRGGVITYVTTITDTGERKQMFGFTARHLKTSMTVEASPDACDQQKMRYDTDGWYIDFDFNFDCMMNMPPPRTTPGRRGGGCQDVTRFKRVGTAKTGYPVMVTTTFYNADGTPSMSSTTEVVELSKAPLDAALFDIPAGYTETKDTQELYGMNAGGAMSAATSGNRRQQQQQDADNDGNNAASSVNARINSMTGMSNLPKRPGTLRVGVAGINNKTTRTVSVESLRDQLVGSLSGSNIDAIPLNASAPSDIEAEAAQKSCDFILYTDIAVLKQSAARKLGGLLGRATGVDTSGVDKSESQVQYRLMAAGSASAILQASATAKEEGDEQSVGTALRQEAQKVLAEVRKKK